MNFRRVDTISKQYEKCHDDGPRPGPDAAAEPEETQETQETEETEEGGAPWEY